MGAFTTIKIFLAGAALAALAACATAPTSGGGGVSTRPDAEPFAPGSTVRPFYATSNASPDPVFNILFVADRGTYGDLSDPARKAEFEADAQNAIDNAFHGVQGIYLNRDEFHYYVSDVAGEVTYNEDCVGKDFSGVASDVRIGDDHAVFDLRLILHKRGWPDCRQGREASADAGDFGVIAHEAAHALFNIPDEYGGGGEVWETNPGIMYPLSQRAACENRKVALGVGGACEQKTFGGAADWWRADDGEDLMSIRQINRKQALEFGRADWATALRVMEDKRGPGSIASPSVFGPAIWP
ncbi:MAG: hypothetical protein AAGD92_05640 [Pseudomonadota bacterium]